MLRRVAPVLRIPASVQRLAAWGARLRGPVAHDTRTPSAYAPLVMVFDAKAACRVLSDRGAFGVQEYERKMRAVIGPFLLGLDYDDPGYRAQMALWQAVLGPGEADAVRRYAHEAAQTTSPLDPADGSLDVVRWTGRTLERFVADYFGVPTIPSPNGDHGSTLLQLLQRTSSYVFNVDLLTGHLAARAKESGKILEGHFLAVLQDKLKAGARPGGDVVDRLLAEPDGARDLRRLSTVLAGTLSGLFVPTSTQFVHVVDYLLDLPRRDLEGLRAAASERAGLSAEERTHRRDLVARYVLEAARFDPFPMGLIRFCPEGATLEAGNGRTAVVPRGATVVAMMNAVALDPRIAPQPGAFLLGRPDGHYLLFGAGQHRCLGASPHWPVAIALMTEMATELFRLPGLRRAAGRRGTLTTRDSWPDALELAYDARGPS